MTSVSVSFLLALFAGTAYPAEITTPRALYDPNPQHLWNRLYDALFIRQDQNGNSYGFDALDPLLWNETTYLLAGSSHRRALNVLNEFLSTHGEEQIRDPLKRALLQHSLWAIFDWSAFRQETYPAERRDLQIRLAQVLRRLALTSEEIKSLPDNYAQAVGSGAFAGEYDPADPHRTFLPPGLLERNSPWVRIRSDWVPVAETHVGALSGRSGFLVFIRLPQGRKATIDYLQALWNSPEPWVASDIDRGDNPNLPQFPVGTEVALLRQMNLFDRDGHLVSTPITESVQFRVYRTISSRRDQNNIDIDWPVARKEQVFFEIRFSQARLFAGQAGGLRAVAPAETEFATFQTQGRDAFDHLETSPNPPILDRCVACHSAPGIHSLQSRKQLLKPNRAQFDPVHGRNPDDFSNGLWWEFNDALFWKEMRYDWGLLNGYWLAAEQAR